MAHDDSHETLVGSQFGAQAEAYLTSSVHAKSDDLDALVALAGADARGTALDLGCGGGHAGFGIAPFFGRVIAYDLSDEMLAVVRRGAAERGLTNLSTRQGRVEALPFDDDSIDLVVSRFSAHHWTDPDAALREARRVLKPGGRLVLADTVSTGVPILDTFHQAIELLRDCSHVRNYSDAEWQAALARAGFLGLSSRRFRMRLDFASWVARMRTPPVQVEAIRALQRSVSARVTGHFDTEADGSHMIDVGLFEAGKPG